MKRRLRFILLERHVRGPRDHSVICQLLMPMLTVHHLGLFAPPPRCCNCCRLLGTNALSGTFPAALGALSKLSYL